MTRIFPRWPLKPGDRFVNTKGVLLGYLIAFVAALVMAILGLLH